MPAPMNPDVKPVGDQRSHKHRMTRLGAILPFGGTNYIRFGSSDFFTREATRETLEGTQFDGENHRRIAPYLQESLTSDRDYIMDRMERAIAQDNYAALGQQFDVAIIGSGPHGAATAAYLREKRPELRTIIIEQQPLLGGQWANYGPKPVFQMNSRVRKADRRLPALPRTQGSINPLGKYAPLELSDLPTSTYAWNTEMADVCAMNSFLSANVTITGWTVTEVRSDYDNEGNTIQNVVMTSPDEGERVIRVRVTVDATGITSGSRFGNPNPNGDFSNYFTAQTFYKHFANHPCPLAMFHEANVAVVGGGDSALTALEALVGNLPKETYGSRGVGRMRPRRIDWIGAKANVPADIERCLRSRYKNGITQALRRVATDECGVIVPTDRQASALTRSPGDSFFDLRVGAGDAATTFYPNVIIDCTSTPVDTKADRAARSYDPTYFVGPNSGRSLPRRARDQITKLGIPENNVSLWATMSVTDDVAQQIVDRVIPMIGR